MALKKLAVDYAHPEARTNIGPNGNGSFRNLTMAFSTNEAMTMIYDAGTPEWPSGLAWKIMESMKKKFAPNDTISKVELRRQLNKISMKRNRQVLGKRQKSHQCQENVQT